MANGTILSFKLLIHCLLTLLPTAVAALSKLAVCFTPAGWGAMGASAMGEPRHGAVLWLSEAGLNRSTKGQLASSNVASAVEGQSQINSHGKAKHRAVFPPAKAQLFYKLLEIFFPQL